MKFTVNEKKGLPVIFVYEDQLADLTADLKDYLETSKKFSGKKNEIFTLFGPGLEEKILLGLGKKEDLSLEILRRQAYLLGKTLAKEKISAATIAVPDFKQEEASQLCAIKSVAALVEGLYQSTYVYDQYKSDKEEAEEISVDFSVRPGYEKKAALSIEEMTNLMEGVFVTRDLVNAPAIDLYPETLAQKAKEILEPLGVKVTVYEKKEIEDLGMHAFLAVSKGSEREPRFIKMEYHPVENGEILAIVGKGLTYDSGGYALKPAKGMVTMNSDMGGAGSVIGTLYALAKNKVQRNVTGLIAACENMISGGALKNGDIISSMKGSSIEVNNTDAEGRLTLADAIYYAASQTDASAIVDLATLTGAALVAVGDKTTAVISNNDELASQMQKASEDMGEYFHRLVGNEALYDMVKGERGDLNNSPGPFGGTITAGLFLEHFAENKPWIHLDIAGPSYLDAPWQYLPKNASGVPVKTLYKFVFDGSQDKLKEKDL